MTRPSFWVLGLGIALEFATILIVLLKIFPKPIKQTDYLVIGTLATFVALGTLFGILMTTTLRDPSAFRKIQRADSPESADGKSSDSPGESTGED